MIAGDGYAYLAYLIPEYACGGSSNLPVAHLRLLRVNSEGAYDKIDIKDFTPDGDPGLFAMLVWASIITTRTQECC
jgi:hypothetical protein